MTTRKFVTNQSLKRNARSAQRLGRWTTDFAHPARFILPYAFEPLPIAKPKYVYLPVNRNYTELNNPRKVKVDYLELARGRAVVFKTDPLLFVGIWTYISPTGVLYLYGPDIESRFDYFHRLDELFQKNVSIFGKHGEDFEAR